MDTKLHTFLTLCQTMNYRLAAQRLHLSQPAVTKQIQALEQALQTKLFYYDGHTLHKTEKCLLLERYAITMQYQFEELRLAIAEKERTQLRIGATKTIGDYVLIDAIKDYLSDPSHELALVVDNTKHLLQMLDEDQLDFAVIEGTFSKTKYDSYLLRMEPFVGICAKSSPLCGREVSIEELLPETIIVREEGSGTRRIFEERLMASGIPIRSQFLTPPDRSESRRQLHLPEQGLVVLLFSGSIGCGRFTQVVPALEQQLPEDASLVVVCGENKRLANRLRKRCGDRCRIIGFTKRMADYMAASDVCISKPGGLSTTEMLTMGLPMVLMHSVPGCETHNLNFFTDARGAVGTDQWSEAIRLCAQLVRQPDKLAEMRQNLLAMGYPGGADVIARTVIEDYERI